MKINKTVDFNTIKNSSIGISVSNFYNCFIILNHFDWDKKGNYIDFEVSENLTNIIHVTHDKVNDVTNFMINKILALNDRLTKKVKEGLQLEDSLGDEYFNKTYAPVGRIIFTDTESVAPLEGSEPIGRLRKDFYVRFSLYQNFDNRNHLAPKIDVEKFTGHLRQTLVRDLIDVVEQLKEEETFTAPTAFLKKFESIGIIS